MPFGAYWTGRGYGDSPQERGRRIHVWSTPLDFRQAPCMVLQIFWSYGLQPSPQHHRHLVCTRPCGLRSLLTMLELTQDLRYFREKASPGARSSALLVPMPREKYPGVD